MSAEPFAITRCGFVPEVKDIDHSRQRVTCVVSSDSVDRAGDIIDATGWKLATYKRNPVVLLDHSYSVQSIVGKCVALDHDDTRLYATTEFGSHPLGVEAFLLVEEGLARAWSVGFRGVKYHSVTAGKSEDMNCEKCRPVKVKYPGFHFTEAELLEYSLVAIPMNADAVTNAIKRGVSRENIPFLFRAIDAPPTAGALDGANARTVAVNRSDFVRAAAEGIARKVRGQQVLLRTERYDRE